MTAESSSGSSNALRGIVVADLTHTLAGPLCTQMMADAGATVIKIEPPGGEWSRIRGLKRMSQDVEVSGYSACINRGKRSIVLDAKSEHGRALIRELIARADILVENFAPASMERMGLGLDDLRKEFPRLITVSISLFGAASTAGRLAERGGFAIIAEAESGILAGLRDTDGVTVPIMSMAIGDMSSGLAAFGGAMTALFERERTGVGQHVEISMVRTLLTINGTALTNEQILRTSDGPIREHRTGGYGLFRTIDGEVVIAVTNDRLFARLAKAIEREDMITDPRYGNFRERDLRVDEINDAVTAWTSRNTTQDVVDALEEARIPVGRIQTAADLVESKDIARLGFLETVEDGGGGEVRAPQSPIGLRQTRSALPKLDQHRDEILSELGYGPNDIDRLATLGAFG